ncbi:hypothetical protein N9A15_00820 [Candidatus Pelagibacter sp.]|nr:hypothetical protein [Candidatus Pelagibacter sp.]
MIFQIKLKFFFLNDDTLRQKVVNKNQNKYFKLFNLTIVAKSIINKTFDINKKYFWEDKK